MVKALIIAITFAFLSPVTIQDRFPAPPNDATLVYYLNNQQLSPIPFEQGLVRANVLAPAADDKVTQVRVKGTTAITVLDGQDLRFYVFVGDRMDPPPHQLVRLTARNSSRELKISLIKGRKGYAPFDHDTLKLDRRLLERLRVNAGAGRIIFINYMELRPRENLTPGEYAIIGDSLADMATFRIK